MAGILSKYGLAEWLLQSNLDWGEEKLRSADGELLKNFSFEERVRMAFEELGTSFVKVGQILSSRPDVIGQSLTEELSKLTGDLKSDSYAEVHKILVEDFGPNLKSKFAEFEEQPIASASIGQVHRARLASGERVMVKVRHPNIKQTVERDMQVLVGLARVAESVELFSHYRPVQLAEELRDQLFRELDFQREAMSLDEFYAYYGEDSRVRVPKPFRELCTSRVLVMSELEGQPVSKLGEAELAQLDMDQLAYDVASVFVDMIFKKGVYHCDPHPGNMLLKAEEPAALIDFGMVARLKSSFREDLEDLVLAVVDNDTEFLADTVIRLGEVPQGVDRDSLAKDFQDYFAFYASQDVAHLEVGAALKELINIIHRYRIVLPTEISMILKVLIMLEGTSRRFNPSFSLLQILKDHYATFQFRRFSPENQWRKALRLASQTERLLKDLPTQLSTIISKVANGKLQFSFRHQGINSAINRLVVGLITSSMLLSSALLLSHEVPPLVLSDFVVFGGKGVSLLGLGVFVVSLIIGLRLLWAIKKSGHIE